MDNDNMYLNEAKTSTIPFGISRMHHPNSELNCSFFNPNWENSMDQNDPFESALSSMVSSPTASNANCGNNNGENIVLRELIGRLGSICQSGEISPQQPYSSINGGGNNSVNTSCYSTPLNSPPKLNLSIMENQQQIRGANLQNSQIQGNNFQNLAPFPADPGFAERAARFSCFANKGLGGLSAQMGFNEISPKLESGKISRVSSSMKNSVQELQEAGISPDNKKFSKLSRCSTPEKAEFGDSGENSSVSEQIPGGEIGITRKRKSIPKGKAKENLTKDANVVASENSESSAKRNKSGDSSGNEKDAAKTESEKQSKDNSKPLPEAPKDYIHVRARRGQATDAHSLAERVRREKISERMKVLQDLVPGCNKVTGKAVMLDEIINYVQSLQRQVEFLSMKLATVNPRMDFNVEALISKDMFQSRGSLPHNVYPSESYPFQSQVEAPFQANSNFNAAFGRNQLPPMDNFGETASQVSTFWEDDLHSVVQMEFSQNQTQFSW